MMWCWSSTVFIWLAILHLHTITSIKVESCTQYAQLLPDGVCTKYLKNKLIAQSKPTAIKVNNKLVTFYESYIPIYASYPTKSIKDLLNMYLITTCGNKKEIKALIHSINFPSASQVQTCFKDINKFLCQYFHPICERDSSGEIGVAVPCQDVCERTLGTPSCSFVKSLLWLLEEVSTLCPEWASTVRKVADNAKCETLPASTTGAEYCFKTALLSTSANIDEKDKDNITVLNNIPSREIVTRREEEAENNEVTGQIDDIQQPEYMSDQQKIRPELNELTSNKNTKIDQLPKASSAFNDFNNYRNTESCIAYDKVLPTGICKDFLKNKMIAQTSYAAVKRNQKAVKFYEQFIPLYASHEGEKMKEALKVLLYVKVFSNICGEDIKSVIDQLVFPSPLELAQCSYEIKRILCELYHPVCLNNGHRYVKVSLCRNKCKKISKSPSCSLFKSAIKVFRKGIQSCPKIKREIEKFDCNYYPTRPARHEGDEYCLPAGPYSSIDSVNAIAMGKDVDGPFNNQKTHEKGRQKVEASDFPSEHSVSSDNLLDTDEIKTQNVITYENHQSYQSEPNNMKLQLGISVRTTLFVVMAVIILVGGVGIFIHKRRRKHIVNVYRDSDQKPDIHYVPVTDNNEH